MNKDLTSKDTKISSWSTWRFLRRSIAYIEFFILTSDRSVNGIIISDKNFESLWVGAPMDEIMGLIGFPSLWVFIRP